MESVCCGVCWDKSGKLFFGRCWSCCCCGLCLVVVIARDADVDDDGAVVAGGGGADGETNSFALVENKCFVGIGSCGCGGGGTCMRKL